jgi:hypothetical protein
MSFSSTSQEACPQRPCSIPYGDACQSFQNQEEIQCPQIIRNYNNSPVTTKQQRRCNCCCKYIHNLIYPEKTKIPFILENDKDMLISRKKYDKRKYAK